jgi:ubiquinol-cytochrome c reductase iron-sulfur subunit
MADEHANLRRRRLLVAATTSATGAATVGAAVPFVMSLMPSEAAKAAGAPVDADISKVEPGQKLTVAWRGKPVWIVHRTKEMLDAVRADDDRVADPQSRRSEQPPYAQNEYRSIKPDYLVVIGICTHLGCSPVDRFKAQPEPFDPLWHGGFYCPCHGSLFDLAGRVYKNKPAPTNLVVPPYKFLTPLQILLGDDKPQA